MSSPKPRRLAAYAAALGLAAAALLFHYALPTAEASHTSNPSSVTIAGSLQSELGCPGDWQPECPQTRLQLVSASSPNVFHATFDVPQGGYEYKVALNNSWDENYGAGGVSGGANIAITAPGGPVTFTYDHATHIISDDIPRPLQAVRGAHWLWIGVIAWKPPAGAQTYRLHYASEGGLKVENGAIAGGSSVPLTLNPAGLPADVRAEFPHIVLRAVHEARLAPTQVRQAQHDHSRRVDHAAATAGSRFQERRSRPVPRLAAEPEALNADQRAERPQPEPAGAAGA